MAQSSDPAEDTQLIVSEQDGFTITVPASWQQEEPAEDGSVAVSDPDTQSRCYAMTILDARPVDAIAAGFADLIRDDPDFEEVSEPRPVDIPAGEAFVIDYFESGADMAWADYYVQGDGLVGYIACAGPDRPEDDWLTIAETFEFLVATPIVAQDEVPATTVVPDEQFCNLLSNAVHRQLQLEPADLAACTQALTTLASAGMLPQAFAGLLTAVVPAEAELTTAGKSVTIKGRGSKNTKPFTLAEGDYEVTMKKTKGCNEFTYAVLDHTSGGSAGRGLVDQDGYMYAVEEGRYFWDATADNKCKWAYTLTPFE